MVLTVDQVSATISENQSESSVENASDDTNKVSAMIDEVVFPHDQVVDVNIEIDEETYADMIANAMSEEYVMADITYNGYTFNNVAIRPKGNSSLMQVASSGDDRFSFKIDFDKYVDDQSFFGVTKLNLNNLFEDNTLMAEFIGYEMLDSIGAVASDTTYVALSINGEYFGLYLAVEQVDETMLYDEYDNYDGELYKPDMGVGADLIYISDDPDDYEGIFPEDDTMTTDEKFIELVKTIDKIVENGGETDEYKLSDIMNVESFLQYMAYSSAVIHLDTYQGGMYHNYYLYYNTDTDLFEWISWDLNMTFNGFPMTGLTDEQATQLLIDEPTIGAMSDYSLINAVFSNETYIDIYHDYLDELLEGYLSEEAFQERVLEIYTMIEPYASIDPSSFYDFSTVKTSIFDTSDDNQVSLVEFVEMRTENISQQLDGTIEATNNGEGNEGQKGMNGAGGKGDMMGGKGGMQGGQAGQRPEGGMMQRPTDGEDSAEMPQMPAGENGEMPQMPTGETGERPQMQNGDSGQRQGGFGGMEMTIDMLPAELLEMHENGLLPEEISEYLDNGEVPPMEMMMELAEEMGVDTSNPGAMMGGNDNGISNEAGTMMNPMDMIQELAVLGLSLATAIGLIIYLSIRKY